jgi:hypothetical protein
LAREESKKGLGAELDKERYRDPITKGIFTETDFDLILDLEKSNKQDDVMINSDSESEFDENEDQSYRAKNEDDISASLLSRDDDTINSGSVNSNSSRQKLVVCEKFKNGECTLTTCPFAHPGLRDSAKIYHKTVKNKENPREKAKIGFVIVCPNVNGYVNDCPLGMECKKYHLYIRPSTLSIIRSIYPLEIGKKQSYVELIHFGGFLEFVSLAKCSNHYLASHYRVF